jgi:hypothetical protein
MPTAFCFSSTALTRLANLRHALDLSARGALAHVCIRVTGDAAFITASTGTILAIVRLAPSDYDGEPVEITVDGAQFTVACATLAKADHATMTRLVINTEDHEVRLTRGTVVCVARVHDIPYPLRSDFMDHFAGQTFVPAIGSYAPSLVATAGRIIGAPRRTALLFWSPSTNANVAACWSSEIDAPASLPVTTVSTLLHQPAFFMSSDILAVIWPLRRSLAGRPDLARFSMPAIHKAESAPSAA